MLQCQMNSQCYFSIWKSFIPGSKLTFSTNLFHNTLLAPTWTTFSCYTGPDLITLLNGFSFLFNFYLLFILGRAVD